MYPRCDAWSQHFINVLLRLVFSDHLSKFGISSAGLSTDSECIASLNPDELIANINTHLEVSGLRKEVETGPRGTGQGPTIIERASIDSLYWVINPNKLENNTYQIWSVVDDDHYQELLRRGYLECSVGHILSRHAFESLPPPIPGTCVHSSL